MVERNGMEKGNVTCTFKINQKKQMAYITKKLKQRHNCCYLCIDLNFFQIFFIDGRIQFRRCSSSFWIHLSKKEINKVRRLGIFYALNITKLFFFSLHRITNFMPNTLQSNSGFYLSVIRL